MLAAQLDRSILGLFQQMFADVKNKTFTTTHIQEELNKAIGNAHMDIIVADDDNDDYDFFVEAMHLTVPNMHVSRAIDGVELIEELERRGANLPGIIFLDLNMPCKNGFECLEAIKNSATWKEIPVIIYSTSANLNQIEQTYKNGASLYIQKPHTFDEIKNTIKKLFSLNLNELTLQPVRDQYLFKL